MQLPVKPPILPMLAKRVDELPHESTWSFEPKWDGFRALIFRDGGEILIQSRDEKSLNRYFPELIDPLLHQLPERYVLDGEIVCLDGQGKPQFRDVLFRRGEPRFYAFDILWDEHPWCTWKS